jgi:hypothetical protein
MLLKRKVVIENDGKEETALLRRTQGAEIKVIVIPALLLQSWPEGMDLGLRGGSNERN